MKFYEAMELLESGKKIRKINWNKNCFLYIDKETGDILDEEKRMYYFTNIKAKDEWEEYLGDLDDRIEVMKVYKDLYKVVNEAYNVHIYDNVILKFIEQNDYRYVIDELKVLLDMMNNVYKLDE